uniref:Uncharacterized protein n=1 Tax=Arundo donax TaxID=35708 RepID=A0A0A8YRB1_ARUDO
MLNHRPMSPTHTTSDIIIKQKGEPHNAPNITSEEKEHLNNREVNKLIEKSILPRLAHLISSRTLETT